MHKYIVADQEIRGFSVGKIDAANVLLELSKGEETCRHEHLQVGERLNVIDGVIFLDAGLFKGYLRQGDSHEVSPRTTHKLIAESDAVVVLEYWESTTT